MHLWVTQIFFVFQDLKICTSFFSRGLCTFRFHPIRDKKIRIRTLITAEKSIRIRTLITAEKSPDNHLSIKLICHGET